MGQCDGRGTHDDYVRTTLHLSLGVGGDVIWEGNVIIRVHFFPQLVILWLFTRMREQ